MLGLPYFAPDGPQIERHLSILNGEARAPFQYRVLSQYVLGMWLQLWPRDRPEATVWALVSLRLVQNAGLFIVGALYYRRLGLGPAAALVACSLLAWGMTQSLYDSNLSYDTYTDVICYLAAGLLIAAGRDVWIVPLAAMAAANRETSGLIPIMLIAAHVGHGATFKRALTIGAAALAAYGAVFIGLRLAYGPRDLYVAYGHTMGLDLFRFNVLRVVTWTQLLATVGIVPLVALAGYRQWPPLLKRFCWAVAPAWLVIHLFCAVLVETRLILAPHALIFVPGALLTVQRWGSADPAPDPR